MERLGGDIPPALAACDERARRGAVDDVQVTLQLCGIGSAWPMDARACSYNTLCLVDDYSANTTTQEVPSSSMSYMLFGCLRCIDLCCNSVQILPMVFLLVQTKHCSQLCFVTSGTLMVTWLGMPEQSVSRCLPLCLHNGHQSWLLYAAN